MPRTKKIKQKKTKIKTKKKTNTNKSNIKKKQKLRQNGGSLSLASLQSNFIRPIEVFEKDKLVIDTDNFYYINIPGESFTYQYTTVKIEEPTKIKLISGSFSFCEPLIIIFPSNGLYIYFHINGVESKLGERSRVLKPIKELIKTIVEHFGLNISDAKNINVEVNTISLLIQEFFHIERSVLYIHKPVIEIDLFNNCINTYTQYTDANINPFNRISLPPQTIII